MVKNNVVKTYMNLVMKIFIITLIAEIFNKRTAWCELRTTVIKSWEVTGSMPTKGYFSLL